MQNRKRDTYVQNRLLDSVGEGEGGMFLENNIEISVLSRVISALFFIYFVINEVTHIKLY